MTPTDLIKRHEGCRLTAYKDSLGIWTIGWGFAQGVKEGDAWTQQEADKRLADQVAICIADLSAYDWFRGLDSNRKCVLVDMRYQLGLKGLLGFHRFITALATKSWDAAADAGLDSAWARETPNRAKENMQIIRSGAF